MVESTAEVSASAVGGTVRRQRHYLVSGIVQGVGFRPYLWHLAHRFSLTGWVRNVSQGVELLVQGAAPAVAEFTCRLPLELPPLAEIRAWSWTDQESDWEVLSDFTIRASTSDEATATLVGPDLAVCPACLEELCDPGSRRWRHAFINCTHCGPRFTLTARMPYDRAHTSMAGFPLCVDCAREYSDPRDRRFHAEPIACPRCGPRLQLLRASAEPLQSDLDPLTGTLRALDSGAIVAIKGVGGFHLACRADQDRAVRSLRRRKQREQKPLALMVANLASLVPWAQVDATAAELLESAARPIVLLPKAPNFDERFPGVAPGLNWVGVMLPYSPLHWLLFHEAVQRPVGTSWMGAVNPLTLVMTSANSSQEPMVVDNQEALEKLSGSADYWLLHDRDILVRCDDSVLMPHWTEKALVPRPPAPPLPSASVLLAPPASTPLPGSDSPKLSSPPGFGFMRRARGYTPRPLALGQEFPPVLALGGQLKNTLCITRGTQAFLTQHGGDLDNPLACANLRQMVAHWLDLLALRPQLVAHDAHPQFFSSILAQELANQWSVPTLAVQHHHAHIAAVLAEHAHAGPALGLALDGYGWGEGGEAWGGELLRVEGRSWQRLAHLRPLPLPGGDRAALEPWRMASAVLHELGRGEEIVRRFSEQALAPALSRYLMKGRTLPATTSMGRWFDAVAGLLGVRTHNRHEGQAAMLLEGLAERAWLEESGSFLDLSQACDSADGAGMIDPAGFLNLLPLAERLSHETDPRRGALRWHRALIRGLVEWVHCAAQREQLNVVALGGGCFLNRLLSQGLEAGLRCHGLNVLQARQVPPNDGGLALGQAWLAGQTESTSREAL